MDIQYLWGREEVAQLKVQITEMNGDEVGERSNEIIAFNVAMTIMCQDLDRLKLSARAIASDHIR
jgi:hypothetical protein